MLRPIRLQLWNHARYQLWDQLGRQLWGQLPHRLPRCMQRKIDRPLEQFRSELFIQLWGDTQC